MKFFLKKPKKQFKFFSSKNLKNFILQTAHKRHLLIENFTKILCLKK